MANCGGKCKEQRLTHSEARLERSSTQRRAKHPASLSTGAELRSLDSQHEKSNPVALTLLLPGA